MAEGTVYVDYADGVKRVMNNAKLYIKLLDKFKTGTNLDELTASLDAGDMAKAQAAAHTIKGVAGNLSFTELYKQTLELETQIKSGTVAPAQIEITKTVFAATMQEVDRVIANHA